MDNRAVALNLIEIARALEYLGENPFKVQAYKKAAQAVTQLDIPVERLAVEGGLSGVPGIGRAIALKIGSWVKDGDFSDIEEIRERLPKGLDELLKVPGLGLKRISLLHLERSIETIDDLLDAVEQGRLSGLRAFPRKFVDSLPASIERVMSYRGKYSLDVALACASEVLSRLAAEGFKATLTGRCRRAYETIERVGILVEEEQDAAGRIAGVFPGSSTEPGGDVLVLPSREGMPPVEVRSVRPEAWAAALLLLTGSKGHVGSLMSLASGMGIEIRHDGVFGKGERVCAGSEEDVYRLLGLQYLPPEVREGRSVEMERALTHTVPDLLTRDDLRGTMHNHTTFSDGVSSLEEMVLAARDRDYWWIGISDHSGSAFYAGGMDPDAVARQHREIDELQKKIDGIEVLKGVESDILADGSLDYAPEVLEGFDFVIASIHTRMDMDRKAMTSRIIKALRNPFTKILAHPTGRIILAREPYDVDMDAVLEEALKNSVAVELNAHPSRLDIDWRLIDAFITQGGMIAISPDAHAAEGFDDMRYGIMMARKGFLTKDACLNARDANEIREFLRGP